jgi:hypothetical protein
LNGTSEFGTRSLTVNTKFAMYLSRFVSMSPDSEVGLVKRHNIGNLSIAQAVDIHQENVPIKLSQRPDEVFENLDLVPVLRASKRTRVILRLSLHGSLKGSTMLPMEVAGGIKRDAVNPGCKARFSFVSVKAFPELGELFSCKRSRLQSPGA